MRRCLNRGIVGTLVMLLGGLPACLNPDISDEAPLTTQAASLDGDDGGAPIDEWAEDDAPLDDAASEEDSTGPNAAVPDDSDPDAEGSGRRRRGFTRR